MNKEVPFSNNSTSFLHLTLHKISKMETFRCPRCLKDIPELNSVIHQVRCSGYQEPTLPLATAVETTSTSNLAPSIPTEASPSEWICGVCTLRNVSTIGICGACDTPLSSTNVSEPDIHSLSASTTTTATGVSSSSTASCQLDQWCCDSCTLQNSRVDQHCQACGNSRPADAAFRDRLITDEPSSGLESSEFLIHSEIGGNSSSSRRINEIHAAALGGLAGAALAFVRGSSVSRGAIAGSSAGLLGSTLLNELDSFSDRGQRSNPMPSLPHDFFDGGPQSMMTAVLSDIMRARAEFQGDPGGGSYEELLARFGTGAPQNGARDDRIDSLPTRQITSLANLSEEHKTCTICLAEFELDDEVKTLPCFHCYHKNCITTWLRQSATCPTCKTNVNE